MDELIKSIHYNLIQNCIVQIELCNQKNPQTKDYHTIKALFNVSMEKAGKHKTAALEY